LVVQRKKLRQSMIVGAFFISIWVVPLYWHNFVYYMARVCHIDGTVGNYRILFYFFF